MDDPEESSTTYPEDAESSQQSIGLLVPTPSSEKGTSRSEEFESTSDLEMSGEPSSFKFNSEAEGTNNVLSADHPLMIKYQADLRERLLKLHLQTDQQLYDLKKTIAAQEKENTAFAREAHDWENELVQQEYKLMKIHERFNQYTAEGKELQEKFKTVEKSFRSIEEKRAVEEKEALEFQKKLEDLAFEVVQLSALQLEAYTDATSLKRTLEKTNRERSNLELQKLRQDLMISRLENDKFKLEDKINLYKSQCAIKKEEIGDLRKELADANAEMQSIHFEKVQIVQQWRQSLSSLEKSDNMLAEIRDSVRSFEEEMRTLELDIIGYKKLFRKELERNEQLTFQMQFRESDIAHIRKNLEDVLNRKACVQEDLTMLEKVTEITENELLYLNSENVLKDKELQAKDNQIQKSYAQLKHLENKYMDVLHEKLTITKATKYTERIIRERKKTMEALASKGAKKENEKEKLRLKLDNLKSYISSIEKSLEQTMKTTNEKEILLSKCEADLLRNNEKMDLKRAEFAELDRQLHEMIKAAGGQELAPFERELSKLKKEIIEAENGQRNQEKEYLRFQRELVLLTKQSSERCKEIDLYRKRIAIMGEKKTRMEAEINKEEMEIKAIKARIQMFENDIVRFNKHFCERKEIQEDLQQASELTKGDFLKLLKEAELNSLRKRSELDQLKKKKNVLFCNLIDSQREAVVWESKVHLVEETRKILKSDAHVAEISALKSEIRRLQVKLEHIKKEQEYLVQEMSRAVSRHTSLYVQADKVIMRGYQKKSHKYVATKIERAKRKLQEYKKEVENGQKEVKSKKFAEFQINKSCEDEAKLVEDITKKIKAVENNTSQKHQEKRQAVITLSFKQKKTKLLQRFKEGAYVRAIRSPTQRTEEVENIYNSLNSIKIITQDIMTEYPHLVPKLNKVYDYTIASEHI